MIQTLSFHLEEKDVPEEVRQESLRTGTPIEQLVKDGLLALARRINEAADKKEKEKESAH